MEGLLILVAIALLFLPFIFSLIALIRSSRLKVLEEKLQGLERELRTFRQEGFSVTKASPASSEPLTNLDFSKTESSEITAETPTSPQRTPSWVPPSYQNLYQDLAKEKAEASTPIEAVAPESSSAPVAPEEKLEQSPEETGATATSPAEPPPLFTPAPASAPMPPSKHGSGIEWERWIGVRGAAMLGGIVLALAGILFFKYSIEHGLISPTMRVIIGTLVGLFCLIFSARMRHKQYLASANAVAAGGIVILYAAFWAAKVLYGLIGMGMAFALMASVTATCCLLCLRYSSKLIAILGILGGFATPILLSTGTDRPISLFSYILLLDLAFIWIAQKKQWSSVALLSLIATFVIETAWMLERMTPERLWLGLSILALFSTVYLLASQRENAKNKLAWKISQFTSMLFAFGFAFYFAAQANFTTRLYPLAVLILLLNFASLWISRKQKGYLLASMTAAATLGVYGIWTLTHWIDPFDFKVIATESLLEVFGLFLATGLLFHSFVEFDKENSHFDGPAPAAILANTGLFAILIFNLLVIKEAAAFYWLLAFLAFAAILLRQAGFLGRRFLQVVAPVLLAIGFGVFLIGENATLQFGEFASSINLLIPLSVACLLHIVSELRKEALVREYAFHGAATSAFLLTFFICGLSFSRVWPGELILIATLILGFLIVLSATRLSSSFWYAIAIAVTAFAHNFWTFEVTYLRFEPATLRNALILQGLSVLLFTFWPLMASRRFKEMNFAWVVSALAGPLWFFSLKKLFILQFGHEYIGALPVALALLSGIAATQTKKFWQPIKTPSRNAQIWFSAVSLSFISVAIPLQLNKEWILIGWALQALALFLLWKKAEHPGLKYFGFGLMALVIVRLFFYPDIIAYYPRGEWRVLNWTMYTYLIPAFCLIVAANLLYRYEIPRLSSWEKRFYLEKFSPMAAILSISAIILIFIWINLAIADWFALGKYLSVSFERLPARDLTTSIAWALYALILLLIGMWKDRGGLRWISLIFLIITIGKVFLYDLGQLRDLYRVLSLLGLALSLILVSLLYQRFVFKKKKPEAS